MSLISELKRRKVFKVAAGYLVVAWLAGPGGVDRLPGLRCAALGAARVHPARLLGFPIALVLAWVFDVTPEGVKLDANRRPATSACSPWRRC